MHESYEPPSSFLVAVSNNNVPLTGNEFAEANLERLIALTRDEDRTNRDWATFLLAQTDIDTENVRSALVHAAKDDDQDVRAEAIAGLAKRDRALALPFVQFALLAQTVTAVVFEAATEIGHPSLVENLRRWSKPSGDAYLDGCVVDALAACEKGLHLE